MSNYLITGGGRGLGLELAKQLVRQPRSQVAKIFVTLRGDIPAALQKVVDSSDGRVSCLTCTVTSDSSVKQFAVELERQIGEQGLDVLINNVGQMPFVQGKVSDMDPQSLITTFDVNVVSAHRVTAALIPLLQKGKEKKIIMISTTVGSIALARGFAMAPTYQYKVTKAALNMLTVQYALAYEQEGFVVCAVSPGWLKTDLGTDNADLEVDVGGAAVLEVIQKANEDSNGKLLNIHVPGWEHAPGPNRYDGKVVDW